MRPRRLISALFGRVAPTVLEIASGWHPTADIAAAHPEINYLAVEVHPPGVGNLCNLLDDRRIRNVRVISTMRWRCSTHMIAPSSLAGAYSTFQIPGTRTAQQAPAGARKPPLVALLASRFAAGVICIATDWVPYAEQMLEVLSQTVAGQTATDYAPRPEWRPRDQICVAGSSLRP